MGRVLLRSLEGKDRTEVQTVLSFPPGSVGSLMELDFPSIRGDVMVEVALRQIRQWGGLPKGMDQIFVVDRGGALTGALPLRELLIHEPEVAVSSIMTPEPLFFHTHDPADQAVQSFERYDLITAPVVNLHHQLVGVLTVDAVMDHINEAAQRERLTQVGLREDEDLFAPIWKSGRNRWAWLAVNLVAALVASRVIGAFEGTIDKLVALAALMPIIASVGGNTGNQTVALVIRGLALDQIGPANLWRFLRKELGIGIMNGAIWGTVVGLFALAIYGKASLAGLMAGAMSLNLAIASVSGVLIPYGLHRLGRDPIMGSSVILTAITDSMGFFIFLGLAAVFLV